MAEAFSDEELQGLKQGNFRLTKKFSGEIVANWIDRFLATITARDKRIWNLEKLTTIDADKRASDRRKSDTIADQTAEIERLRGERKADLELMERCRDVIGCFIHDEDANVLPETTLLKTEILEFDEMFERLDEVVEAARQALDAGKEKL